MISDAKAKPPPDHDDRHLDHRLLVRAPEVATILAISVREVWRKTSDGTLPAPIKLGNSTRWRMADLEEFVEGLEG